MAEITELLGQANHADSDSLNQVFSQLHAELKILARSRIHGGPNQTMTATALVHELYLKFVGAQKLDLQSRHHFFACAGAAMRQILVDAARARSTAKRGGDLIFVTLVDPGEGDTDSEVLVLNDVLEELEQIEPELMELVHLRFFAGLTMNDIAELKGKSVRSMQRDWICAQAFLSARMNDQDTVN